MRILNILGTLIITAFTVVAVVGSYESHDYTIKMKPQTINEEVIILETEEMIDVSEIVEIEYVKSEIQVMAEAIMGEAGSEPLVGKVAVAATILNKMEYYNITVYEALEAYDAYPYYGVVTNECYCAVEIAMENRDLFPRDMMYFRTEHYHNFGVPYVQIGNHYFSCKGE